MVSDQELSSIFIAKAWLKQLLCLFFLLLAMELLWTSSGHLNCVMTLLYLLSLSLSHSLSVCLMFLSAVYSVVPHLKDLMGRMLPMMGAARQENIRWVFATSKQLLQCFLFLPTPFLDAFSLYSLLFLYSLCHLFSNCNKSSQSQHDCFRNTVKLQIFVRYPFSYFWLETGSYELIFILSRASKQNYIEFDGLNTK